MKNLFILIFSFTLISCGDISPKGSIESKDLPLEDFVNIDLDGKFRVFYVKSDSSFVNVETYPNVFNNLKINVEDKTLTIKEKRATKGVDFYNITLYSKYQPERIKISDSVEINVSSEIKTDNFRLNLKNYAKFIGSVNTRRAEVEMADRSQANFLGKSQHVNLKISDSTSIIAPYWNIDNLKLESTDANYAEVNVRDSLKGSVNNTAKLVYYNNPIRAFKIAPTATVQNKKID